MTSSDPLDRLHHELSAYLRATTAPAAPTLACLDDVTVAGLAEGSLDGATRAAAVAHLSGCSRCRGAVASVSRALADPAVRSAVAGAEAGTRRRRWWIVLPATAAAALLLVVSLPKSSHDNRRAHRERAITAVAGPVLDSPVGAVAGATVLRWSTVAGADRYRLTLFDARAHVVYETQLTDTVAVLPDSIVLVPGQRYLWRVVARTGWNRWSASDLVEFRIVPGVQP